MPSAIVKLMNGVYFCIIVGLVVSGKYPLRRYSGDERVFGADRLHICDHQSDCRHPLRGHRPAGAA